MIDTHLENLLSSYVEKLMDELAPRSWECTDMDELRANTHRLLFNMMADSKLIEYQALKNTVKYWKDL